jgi:integrase
MPSVWITIRQTKGGGKRYRVLYHLGGRGARTRYAGSFKSKREALLRKNWVAGELAALRVPDLAFEAAESPAAPTLAEAAARWQASRVDVAGSTSTQHQTALNRALPMLGERRVDAITAQDIADLVARLAADGLARGSIKQTLSVLAMTLDHAGISPNPARDRIVIRLPREEPEEPNPPSAEHIEAVYHLLPSKHRLALLFLDWSGARVSAIDKTAVGDYDEQRRRVRLRAATTKKRRALWIELHPVLADAIEQRLGPREDRDPAGRLFPDSGSGALRTAIWSTCRAAGIPVWSPHDLRHRRISLLHLRGVPWARIGEFVGQRNLVVTANTYTHVLLDETEVDYANLLGDART